MRYLLDTNVCIRYLTGRSPQIRERLESQQPEDVALCSIVKADLLHGALKSARPRRNLDRIHRFTGLFESIPFDDEAAQDYGEIRSRLEKAGTPIGPNDLLISAIARSRDLTLVTHNVKDFSRVTGLRWEDWEIPLD